MLTSNGAKKIIVGNWKMNPKTALEARKLFSSLEHRLSTVSRNVETVICPPAVFFPPLSHYSHLLQLGAQNMSWAESGSLTGEISPLQLLEWNVKFVILGHSERRIYLGETDSMVSMKLVAALKAKLRPIVCLGGEEGAKQTDMVKLVTKQFNAAVKTLDKKAIEKIIFAYEPTWAISTMKNSKPASGKHAQELIAHIRALLAKKLGAVGAKNMPVIYGGTGNKDNVAIYAKFSEIDGALVGAASLDSDNFWAVISEFNRQVH
jgi:triosephosphate isomerase (TIM)